MAIFQLPEASVYLQMTTMKPGTLRWAAPEHFLVDAEQTMRATTQSDIYSFGNLGLLASAVSSTTYILISFQVLSGKHPWSEIRRDTAVIMQLSQGNKPKRPSSCPIEDQHWELIERCWSSVGDRPYAKDVVSSLQQFLHSFPSPLPLVDIFRVLSHSSISAPQSTLVVPTLNLLLLEQYLSAPDVDTTLNSPPRSPLLTEWVKLKLVGDSWKDALLAAVNFTAPRFTIYRVLCDHLETLNQITVVAECFHQMSSEFAEQTNLHAEQAQWVLDFKKRLSKKLEHLGDATVNGQQLDAAISEYSSALSLNPVAPSDLIIGRSKASFWEDALNDANRLITLDPSSPWGYERKHAALHRAGRYDDAISTFETMLSKMSQSPDPETRERHREYVNPEQTKAAIRAAIEIAIRESPLALINTDSGRLLDKPGQACSFELQPAFRELISSMTTHINHARIEREVVEYYRYATFSHSWEDNEPLFEEVIRIVVYDLEESPTHDKLQMFCKIVRDSGFHWAWSDTCCINKADHFVLQEALVSMFKWYEGSAATIVLLRGVRSPSKRGDLMRSIWNTRAWTLQEYHASQVIRFYTEDWKLYLNLDIPNHKESPEIIVEMEEAIGVSARALMDLRPGLDDIREKLCLASTRQTTRVEDSAYSLLGIFSVSLPVVYGEGDLALGRLLAQLLTSSGDTSIFSWTGRSGSFNSCLPASITVFNQPLTMHIPRTLERAGMGKITTKLGSSNATSIMMLYDRLHELPAPSFAGRRMKLPCLRFKLGPLSTSRSRSGHVFRAHTAVGVVEIKANEDVSRFEVLQRRCSKRTQAAGLLRLARCCHHCLTLPVLHLQPQKHVQRGSLLVLGDYLADGRPHSLKTRRLSDPLRRYHRRTSRCARSRLSID
ncbi:hypothetical protein OG21DRAFT_859147 [Imleria badia]|nr:hypothetical protein OG21DRAFT_859147 [Imleria badia]